MISANRMPVVIFFILVFLSQFLCFLGDTLYFRIIRCKFCNLRRHFSFEFFVVSNYRIHFFLYILYLFAHRSESISSPANAYCALSFVNLIYFLFYFRTKTNTYPWKRMEIRSRNWSIW